MEIDDLKQEVLDLRSEIQQLRIAAVKREVEETKDQTQRRRLREEEPSSIQERVIHRNSARPANLPSVSFLEREKRSSDPPLGRYSDSEDETLHRHRRPRANVSIPRPRATSPLSQPFMYDLKEQADLLDRVEMRQDMEILRQQREIDRLEQRLASFARRRHGSSEAKALKTEEERYEDEITERLRRLEWFERKARKEEEEEEERAKERRVRREELSLKQEKMREMRKRMEKEEEREQLRKEVAEEEARRKLDEQRQQDRDNAIRHAAVEEYKMNQINEECLRVEIERQKRQMESEIWAKVEAELGQSLDQVKALIARMRWESNNREALVDTDRQL